MAVMTVKKRAKKAHAPKVEQQTIKALKRLQSSIREVIKGTPGMTRRPTDLTETLEIPYKLAWQVHRLAHADDPLAQAGNVPGPTAMERFLEATERRGASADRVAAVRDALQTFEQLIDTHASSRGEFDSILTGLSATGSEHVDLSQKRAAFKAQSHIWGSSMRTRLGCFIVHPASKDKNDVLSLIGNIDYYRLHGERPYVVSRSKQGTSQGDVLAHPLTGDITKPGSTILAEFCTQPLPNLRNYVDDEGSLIVEIAPADVGKEHAITSHVAELYRSATSRYRMESMPTFCTSGNVRMPISTWITDLIIAEGTYGTNLPVPRGYIVGNLEGKPINFDHMATKFEKDILDRPEVMHLGKGAAVLKSPDVPRYREIFEHLCEKLGWDPAVFHVFRCRIEYPVMPSAIGVGFDLPEKPE